MCIRDSPEEGRAGKEKRDARKRKKKAAPGLLDRDVIGLEFERDPLKERRTERQ